MFRNYNSYKSTKVGYKQDSDAGNQEIATQGYQISKKFTYWLKTYSAETTMMYAKIYKKIDIVNSLNLTTIVLSIYSTKVSLIQLRIN